MNFSLYANMAGFAQTVIYLIPYYRSVIICTGAFGVVYKGVYTKNGVPVDVAVKTIKRLVHQLDNEITITTHAIITDTSILKIEEFLKECNIAKRFNHPNVISLIGVSEIPEEGTPCMVLPYMLMVM